MGRDQDEFVPVTGGIGLADDRVRRDLNPLHEIGIESDLDLHIVRLLSLHPKLKVRFPIRDSAGLHIQAKRAILSDMNEFLGIKPPPPRPRS